MKITTGSGYSVLVMASIIILCTEYVTGQAQATVEIGNEPPTVGAVVATDPVELVRDSMVSVWCNATVTDLNGEKSISNVDSVLWNPATSAEDSPDDYKNHYSPSQGVIQATSDLTRNVSFEFLMQHNANPGSWTCKIIVVDRHDAVGENATNITVYTPFPTCDDGYLNQNETGIDCGGPCPPCHCLDGVRNFGEEGIDCGGPCPPCLKFPSKLRLTAPVYLVQYQNASVDVTDDKGTGLFALLRVSKPKRPLVVIRTDDMGHAEIYADVTGIMHVMAVKRGYMPDDANMMVVTKEVAYAVKTTSYLLLLLALILLIYSIRRMRGKLVADKR